MTTFWSIPRDWDGETCFILGGGLSLKSVDVSVLRGRRTIAINNAGLAGSSPCAPWADVHFWHDDRWFRQWVVNDKRRLTNTGHACRVTVQLPGDSCTADLAARSAVVEAARELNVETVEREKDKPFSTYPTRLAGVHSGDRAINLAALKGAARIVLLGFDMKPTGQWHGEHEKPSRSENYATRFMPALRRMSAPLCAYGVEVLNATEDSALDCFPKISLKDVL